MRRALVRMLLLLAVPAAVLSCSSGDGPGAGGGTGGSGSGGSGSGGTGSGSGGATGSGGSSPTGSGGSIVDAGGGSDSAVDTGGGSGGAGPTDGGGTGGMTVGGGQMFGAHKFQYPAGTIKPKGDVDTVVAAFYDRWKAKYLVAGCGGYYIATGGGTGAEPGTVEVSEGHGYGMGILPFMAGHDPNAQKIYDGLYAVYRAAKSINDPNLMAWSIKQDCSVPNGANDFADSATDGDLDIAFSLVVADRQWGSAGAINYLAQAKAIIGSIKAHEINPDTNLLMLGDWADIKAPYYAARYTGTDGPYSNAQPHTAFYYGSRPSDYMLDHLRAFGTATGDAAWMTIVDAHHTLIKKLQDGFANSTGLLPDFVEAGKPPTAPKPAGANYLESEADGRYGYNSCRVPWHIAADYLVSGDARAKTAAQRINTWVKQATGSNPRNIKDGYALNGTATGTAVNFAFEAPFGVAAVVDASNQAWLDAIWADMVTGHTAADTGYYNDTIKMLAILLMSGNWFQP